MSLCLPRNMKLSLLSWESPKTKRSVPPQRTAVSSPELSGKEETDFSWFFAKNIPSVSDFTDTCAWSYVAVFEPLQEDSFYF